MPVAGETTHVRHGPAGDVSRRLVVSMVRLRSKSCPPVAPTLGVGWREAEAVRKTGTFPAGGCGVKDQVSWGAIRSSGARKRSARGTKATTCNDAGCRMQEAGTQDAAQVATQAGPQRAAKKLHHFEGRPPTGVVLRCFPPHATLGESKTNQRRTTCRSSFEAETSK